MASPFLNLERDADRLSHGRHGRFEAMFLVLMIVNGNGSEDAGMIPHDHLVTLLNDRHDRVPFPLDTGSNGAYLIVESNLVEVRGDFVDIFTDVFAVHGIHAELYNHFLRSYELCLNLLAY
jgi:hypothetical protein